MLTGDGARSVSGRQHRCWRQRGKRLAGRVSLGWSWRARLLLRKRRGDRLQRHPEDAIVLARQRCARARARARAATSSEPGTEALNVTHFLRQRKGPSYGFETGSRLPYG